MIKRSPDKICLIPHLSGLGGTATFQDKLTMGLQKLGISVTYDVKDFGNAAILVVGGTRRLVELAEARRRGIPIVQRLDGINWIHRRRYTGAGHFLRAEINNWLIATIRDKLADRIVYQSEFVRTWWQQRFGDPGKPSFIIHNGVDLDKYSPEGPGQLPDDVYRILLVEGRLGGGYHMGLENAVDLTSILREKHRLPALLRVVGQVPEPLRQRMGARSVPIEWQGVLARESIPEQDRSAHALFSADINAACPNSVIEALASGLPILGFDTGALKELVTDSAGRITPYGGDVWRLDPPDVESLADAAVDVLKRNSTFRKHARELAERRFSLETMVERYCQTWQSF